MKLNHCVPIAPASPRQIQVRSRGAAGWWLACALLWLAGAPTNSPADIEILPPEQHLNGSETLALLGDLPQRLEAATFVVFEQNGHEGEPVALGTWVGPKLGLTKNSQLDPDAGLWLASKAEGTRLPAEVVTRNEALDLALVRLDPAAEIGDAGIEPVTLPATQPELGLGGWLVSAVAEPRRPAMIGVVAAPHREIPSSGAIMGLELSSEGERGAVTILNASPGGPAHAAGLRSGDVLTRFNGADVGGSREVIRSLRRMRPGDWVRLSVQREQREEPLEVRLRLVSRTQVERFWFGNHWTDGGLSARSDDFPEVIHHATPVPANKMGGAVFDIEGRWLGLNIARFDRVTTFALPVGGFREWLEEHLGRLGD